MQDLLTAISTVGFPIVVCIISFWYINKQGEEHKKETEALTVAINNNTMVLQRVVDKLEG